MYWGFRNPFWERRNYKATIRGLATIFLKISYARSIWLNPVHLFRFSCKKTYGSILTKRIPKSIGQSSFCILFFLFLGGQSLIFRHCHIAAVFQKKAVTNSKTREFEHRNSREWCALDRLMALWAVAIALDAWLWPIWANCNDLTSRRHWNDGS